MPVLFKTKNNFRNLGNNICFHKTNAPGAFYTRYTEYLAKSRATTDESQPSVDSYFISRSQQSSGASTSLSTKNSNNVLYKEQHPRRKIISEAIVKDPVVGCSLPLSITEHPQFRHFLNAVEPRYTCVSRTTLRNSLIPQLYQKAVKKQDLLKKYVSKVIVQFSGHILEFDYVERYIFVVIKKKNC